MKWQKIIKESVPSEDPRIFMLDDNLYAFDIEQPAEEGKEMILKLLHMEKDRMGEMIEQCDYYEQHGHFKDN